MCWGMKPSVTAAEHDGRMEGGRAGEVGRLRLGPRQSGAEMAVSG